MLHAASHRYWRKFSRLRSRTAEFDRSIYLTEFSSRTSGGLWLSVSPVLLTRPCYSRSPFRASRVGQAMHLEFSSDLRQLDPFVSSCPIWPYSVHPAFASGDRRPLRPAG
ncbi:hypothetical protein BS50DRAFT_95060 [Corynespora cassiicola Philippines]|uniref:Uncharacterized protein n=1 Tax=Corynespora cassiicola Philippines TaxID=1448308 RepID=A0A2T2NEZ1_CORCC|nr:hypothetical protein BS50DRAFT_95060 [Corynespora cassiicola Philippines]